MARTRTVALSEPIEVGGKALAEVVVRRSTVGDEEDAMQQAVQLKRGQNPVTVEMCLLSRVTRLPYDAIRSLHGADYAAIREALGELNGPVPGGPENPTPETDGTPENV
ncbi:phage tail assembly protein [uncultured Desulfovibrio sp.]|uniref:phage tail assembly protein n=1 Tax=uncultured Desulfovibrio sp. TaxID=167968 RepID=UPI0025891A8F|nr:phage tail assembly protein [uncultured Desulfovibrio sp.]